MSESRELEKESEVKANDSENQSPDNAGQKVSKTQKTDTETSTFPKLEDVSGCSMPLNKADKTSVVSENSTEKSESKYIEKKIETENKCKNSISMQSEDVSKSDNVSKDSNGSETSSHVPKIFSETIEPDTVSKDNHVPKISSEGVEESDDEDDEGICLGDGTDLDGEGRNKMFEKGLNYERNGKRNKALKCYMACLIGLKQDTRFPLLPQCLRNIADIFYQKEEYEKAVHFIQAEKVYYESALIDTTDVQHKLEEAQLKEGSLSHSVSSDTVRASEYEHLARLCLDKGQPQLALEYAGKATKLRQQVLGDKDPVTVESLDFFASVYAKVGAEQYEESLKKFTEKPADGEMSMEASPIDGSGDQKEPVSILRKRKNSEKEKKVHFDESQLQSHEQMQHEERFAKSVLWALMVICFILLLILGIYLYCNLVGSHPCTKLRADLHYAYMRLKYWYYQYQAGPNAKFM